MRQRLVLATDSQEPSGVGEHMLTLGQALAGDYDVALAAPDHPAGLALLHRAAAAGLRIKSLDLGQPLAIWSWLGAADEALIHVHAGIGWEGHDLVRHGKAAGLPVVRTEHLPYLLTSPVQQAAYRAMLLSVDGRIAVSQAVYDTHRDQGGGPQVIICNGIFAGVPSSARSDKRRALGLGEHDKLLLTVARFTPQKGHAVLIDAAPAVLQRFPATKFALVGSGPDQDLAAQRIAQSGLAESFALLGHRDDVADLLVAADLFVMPSLFEGLSLALLEAMAAKVPVVATPIGGTVEALGSEHPFLAPPGDAAALAAAIINALEQPELAQAAACTAFQRFEERFSARRMAAETSALYQSILHRQCPRGVTP